MQPKSYKASFTGSGHVERVAVNACVIARGGLKYPYQMDGIRNNLYVYKTLVGWLVEMEPGAAKRDGSRSPKVGRSATWFRYSRCRDLLRQCGFQFVLFLHCTVPKGY